MKSKRTKALEISQKVKEIVWERDNHRCIICSVYVPKSNACSHYIRRTQSGLGIPENIMTMCNDCHSSFDLRNDPSVRKKAQDYLNKLYPDFTDEMRRYKK